MRATSSRHRTGAVREAGRLVPWLCPYLAVWAGFAVFAMSAVHAAGSDSAADLLGGVEVYTAVIAALLLTATLAGLELLLLRRAERAGALRRPSANR
jgi:hypothetical protein